MSPRVGTCADTSHETAARAHLFVAVLGSLAVASALGFAVVEAIITRWHFASRDYHERARREEQ